jgi:hypothetical protein
VHDPCTTRCTLWKRWIHFGLIFEPYMDRQLSVLSSGDSKCWSHTTEKIQVSVLRCLCIICGLFYPIRKAANCVTICAAQLQSTSMTCLSTRLRREQAADWAVSWLLFALCSVLLPGVEAATAAAASQNVWPLGAQWEIQWSPSLQCSLSTVITIASVLTATVITIASVLTATAAPADRPHATTNDSGASQWRHAFA